MFSCGEHALGLPCVQKWGSDAKAGSMPFKKVTVVLPGQCGHGLSVAHCPRRKERWSETTDWTRDNLGYHHLVLWVHQVGSIDRTAVRFLKINGPGQKPGINYYKCYFFFFCLNQVTDYHLERPRTQGQSHMLPSVIHHLCQPLLASACTFPQWWAELGVPREPLAQVFSLCWPSPIY
jgi:hypothetical protein